MSAATLNQALTGRDNSLNFIRLTLASTVIVTHAWVVGGFGEGPAFGETQLGVGAVYGFFAISGYLIAGSRLRLDLGSFMWRRALRIYPAYWVCLLATGLVIAPLASRIFDDHYQLSSGARYVIENSTLWIRHYDIEHTLQSVPEPNLWNGSLWTLFYEFLCYIGAALLLGFMVIRRHFAGAISFVLVVVTGVYGVARHVDFGIAVAMNAMNLGLFFIAGMVIHAVGHRLTVRLDLALASGILVATSAVFDVVWLVAPLPMAYLMLWTGVRLRVRFGQVNDVSYGMYVYTFPVQQVLALADVQRAGLVVFAIVSVACTIPLAVASWYIIERPALTLKNRFPPARGGLAGATPAATGPAVGS